MQAAQPHLGLAGGNLSNLIMNQRYASSDLSYGATSAPTQGPPGSSLGVPGGGVLLLSEQNNSNYLRQQKKGIKYTSTTQANTPSLTTPNRSLDFTANNKVIPSAGGPSVAQSFQFKKGLLQNGLAQNQHKKNAMSLIDYQQVNNSFLDQNLSSIMQHQAVAVSGPRREELQPGRFSVQQRPIATNYTPDLLTKYPMQAFQQQNLAQQ